MKGIILAGGSGTRLFPLTLSVSKQLMPVYDKPMIYYPLSTMMMAGIREVMIISSPEHLPLFKQLLGDGFNLGMGVVFADNPILRSGPAFSSRRLYRGRFAALILGDHIFYGHDLIKTMQGPAKTVKEKRSRNGICPTTVPNRKPYRRNPKLTKNGGRSSAI